MSKMQESTWYLEVCRFPRMRGGGGDMKTMTHLYRLLVRSKLDYGYEQKEFWIPSQINASGKQPERLK